MLNRFTKSISRLLRSVLRPNGKFEDAAVKRVIDTISERESKDAEVVPCPLSRYLEIIGEIPLPTLQQKENFAAFVAHAHSWHKHLPLLPPGVPFHFYLDKYAGCDRVLTEGTTTTYVERKKQGFHYSAIPTDEYRTRFGYLAFSCNAGSSVMLVSKRQVVVPDDKVGMISSDDAQPCGLPLEILEAGVVQLTGVIHTLSGSEMPLFPDTSSQESTMDWPEESGGQVALEKIFARCRMMCDPTFKRKPREIDDRLSDDSEEASYLYETDPVLHELLLPERKRQYGKMIKAMDRVCDIVECRKRS